MDSSFWTPFLTSLVAASATTAGLLTIRRFEPWGRRNITYFVCFAAGVLVSVSFLHIIPTAFDLAPQAPAYLLAGYLGMHILNRFLTAYVCDKPTTKDYVIGLVPLLGIGFHSLIDGVIYSVTFSVNFFTGFVAAAGMVMHEFPEGIVTYLLMIRSGFSKKSAFLFSFLAAAVTTPTGMLLSYPAIRYLGPDHLGILLSLSAGALVYVGATHLLPSTERDNRRFSLIALASGILVAVVIVLSKTEI